MPVGKFNRDISYFQDFRDTNSKANAIDFDTQFNDLVAFINDQMLPVVNTLSAGVPGIEGSPNTFLRNIGDGTTDFSNVIIPDFVLGFSKLIKSASSCAILASASNGGGFVEVATNVNDNVLISVEANAPVWRKIQTNDIEDRTITGIKVARQTITVENMIPGTMVNTVADNSLTGSKFANRSITKPKITRNTIEIRNLGVIWGGGIIYNFLGRIGSRHIMNNTLSSEKLISGANVVTNNHFNLIKFIVARKLASQVINDSMLENLEWASIPINNRLALGYFPSSSLSPNFKLTSSRLQLNYFLKHWFEPDVEQKFADNGI